MNLAARIEPLNKRYGTRILASESTVAAALLQAREAERTRIAREMHDSLSHRLALISLHAGALEYRDDLDPAAAREALADRLRAVTPGNDTDDAAPVDVALLRGLGALRRVAGLLLGALQLGAALGQRGVHQRAIADGQQIEGDGGVASDHIKLLN